MHAANLRTNMSSFTAKTSSGMNKMVTSSTPQTIVAPSPFDSQVRNTTGFSKRTGSAYRATSRDKLPGISLNQKVAMF
jgi:hypothetical protein